MRNINIEKLTKDNNYIVVLDTNIFMRLYDYSPEFSSFCLECLDKIKPFVKIPYTVNVEYHNNYHGGFKRRKNRMKEYDKKSIETIDSFEVKIMNKINELEKMQFPDISNLRENITDRIEEMRGYFVDYLHEHSDLEFINKYLSEDDMVYKLINSIIENEQVMDKPDLKWIYDICDEGEERYKKDIPPGFKDAKNKDGIRKYSDLIIWKEIMKFSLEHKKNIIFITDDIKVDWWERKSSNNDLTFHSKLIQEFKKNTKQDIIGLKSNELFNSIADHYAIKKTESVELALNWTIDDYSNAISDSVFDYIFENLIFSGNSFFSEDETEYFSDTEIEICEDSLEYDFISSELVNTDSNIIEYIFKYNVKLDGESREYLGRDEDTKDVILSPVNIHKFEGLIEVEVIREIDNFIDITEDNSFDQANIVGVHLNVIDSKPWISYEDDYQGVNVCPICGREITFENDGVNGFCNECDPDD
ncbi:hypothetical protein KQI18_12040 [Clostridioides mangenotii]|uniref:PIN-like domain-containing protein n=1 Tax=Metaclostridioides mangenotii TaxID=1540 RepID=UPI001C10658A|nr:PIN-like domain-containing protein [Clostridioides mangenotii]MBU5308507.1 hypothetical protein [Clostridioides mangenotii]